MSSNEIAVRPNEAQPQHSSFLTGMRVCFKDLSYHVKSATNKKERAYLLKNVNGFFEANQMSALMGPSGSGKTTLLDVVAGRKNAGKIEGTVVFSGLSPSVQFLRKYTGYVEQFDTLLGILTVYEMLLYTAELKRPMKDSFASKKAAVDDLIDKLALERCKNTPIGNELQKTISGGQAKRTNIGIALVTNPRVLFLDEPTSGLDSFTANEVMTVVKALTKDGVTICATIHSPTAYCFNLFDQLMMLVRGRIVYFGPQGAEAMNHFRTSGIFVQEYAQGYNDAEYLVALVTDADRKGQGHQFADYYDVSPMKTQNMALLEQYLKEKDDLPEAVAKELKTKSATVTPWYYGLYILLRYRTTKNYQNGDFLGPRIGDKIIFGLLYLTLYLGLGSNFNDDNLNNQAAFLFVVLGLPVYSAAAYCPSLVLDRPLYVRERADGLYRSFTYFIAKMVEELTILCIISIIVSVWCFYGVQLQGYWVVFWITYFISFCNGIAIAYMIASFAPNLDVANAALPSYGTTLFFFGGFLISYSDMPPWWYWYSNIDYIRYIWTAAMLNQFNGHSTQIFSANQTVLEYYDIDGYDIWANVGYASLFFVFFGLVSCLLLSKMNYSTR